MSLSSPFIASEAVLRRYVPAETQLRQKALQFMKDYPDVHGMAWAAARRLLRQNTGKTLNPDKVWWHRFDTASNSPHTFTGWQHFGVPVESMTLVELLMRRFNAHDQEASDQLQVYGGFYLDGPQHGAYDQRNEVAMLPDTFMQQLWKLDFASDFRQRVDAFWATHGQTFCELARARFLAAIGLAVRDGHLSKADARLLGQFAVTEPALAEGGHASNALADHGGVVSVRSFDIAGYESSQILRFVDAQGRQILYLPTFEPAFQVCETEHELYEWVRSFLLTEPARKRWEALFLDSPLSREEHAQAFGAALDRIRDSDASAQKNLVDPGVLQRLNQHDRIVAGDVFERLRDLARQQMQAVAQALTSNASLRKQMWIGYLNTFIRVFGPVTVCGWPLALTLVGAGLANVGLHIDQALNGTDRRQRKAGIIGAVLNSIYVLFNLPLLAGALPAARVTLTGAPGVDSAEEWIPLQVMEPAPLTTGEQMIEGIEHSATGEAWIMLDQTAQQVRYSPALKSWLVVDPLNPFAFSAARAVRLNAQGQWELQPVLRLSGGDPVEVPGTSGAVPQAAALPPYPTVQSSFWDIYMQLNHAEEERLSELALARQQAVINVHEVGPEYDVEVDSEGDEVVVDADGNDFRVFKTAEGRYTGGYVSRYTVNEEAFNQYLRTGVVQTYRQSETIQALADDLSLIGYNNRVTLYRGGSGLRGTSGLTFRQGHIKAGDVLVNTDFTSFSENPYVARSFSSSQAGAPSYGFDGDIHFDDTSIVFELPAEQYLSATPIAPFSQEDEEAESLFAPGHYFKVQNIQEVTGPHYRFIKVQISEVPASQAGERVYEMRTGLPFTREAYQARLGATGQVLVDRFFPAAGQAAAQPGAI